MKCIFCLQAFPDSEKSKEHIIPEALGSRKLVLWDTCHPCNNTLGGKVDCLLINSELVQLARLTLDIKGKAKAAPNVFKTGVIDPETGAPMTGSFNEKGQLVARAIPKHIHEDLGEGNHASKVSINADDAENIKYVITQIQALIKGNPAMKDKAVPTVTEEHARALLETGEVEIVPGLKLTAGRRSVDTIQKTFTVDSENFKPAIVKIIYELAYHWLGPDYLDDPTAAQLRDIVNQSVAGPVDVDAVLEEGGAALGGQVPLEHWKDEKHFHHAFLLRSGNSMLLHLSIFGNYWGTIKVTKEADRYPHAQDMFLSVDPRNSETREQPFLDEIARFIVLE